MSDTAAPTGATQPAPGQPRSDADAAALDRHDRRMQLPLVLSAVLPLVLAPEPGHPVSVAVGICSWLVFLYDFVVHRRRVVHYLGTGFGKFDLVIVILTAPWFLLPGAQAGSAVVILRLARLVRLVVASRGARALFTRLGRVAAFAVGVLFSGALVAFYAEHPTNSEFATFGDALWWAVVTLTTVGYGDITPETTTGRWAGVLIMVTGIAVLGLLAGSLASFFRLGDATEAPGPGSLAPDARALAAQLRDQLAAAAETQAQLARLLDDGESPAEP